MIGVYQGRPKAPSYSRASEGIVETMGPILRAVFVTIALAIAMSARLNSQELTGVRSIVAAASMAESTLLGAGAPTAYDTSFVSLVTVASRCQTIAIIRATTDATYPSHPFTLAVDGTEPIRLGGFQSPQLIAFDALVRRDPLCRRLSLRERTRLLARVADPEGATSITFPADSASSNEEAVLASQWIGSRRDFVMPDTITVLEGGKIIVRLTVLSRRDSGWVRTWRSLSYAFVFGPANNLLDWSVRIGADFMADAGD